jgi:hypothetical protein
MVVRKYADTDPLAGRKAMARSTARWDPLLGRSKRQLATRIRAAEERMSQLEGAYVTSAVQLQELARRNLALEAELAQTTQRFAHLIAEHRGGST